MIFEAIGKIRHRLDFIVDSSDDERHISVANFRTGCSLLVKASRKIADKDDQ